jgi:hypothetical protein
MLKVFIVIQEEHVMAQNYCCYPSKGGGGGAFQKNQFLGMGIPFFKRVFHLAFLKMKQEHVSKDSNPKRNGAEIFGFGGPLK